MNDKLEKKIAKNEKKYQAQLEKLNKKKEVALEKEKAAKEKKMGKRIKAAKKEGGDDLVVKEIFIKDALLDSSRTIKRCCAPDGVNATSPKYVSVEEGGITTYMATLYVESMPKNTTFANTFSSLFNTPDIVSNVDIEPLGGDRSRKLLDKRIIALDSERIQAVKSGDINRQRNIELKLSDAQGWAKSVESGFTALYRVAMFFTVTADSVENLYMRCHDLYNLARETGMELASCYCGQAEALLSAAPLNKVYNPILPSKLGKAGLRVSGMKYHIMDRYSLCTIFNHTQSNFTHENGIVIGRNLHTAQPIVWDPYYKSHNGYSLCVAGTTGTGKSATIKMWVTRYMNVNIDCRAVIVDLDTPDNAEGEYAQSVREMGGEVFTLRADSTNRLNLFDLNLSREWDRKTRSEYYDLKLNEKIVDLLNIFLCIVKDGKEFTNSSTATYVKKVLSMALRRIYKDAGIIDRDINSLYTTGETVQGGVIVTGRVKKKMPIFSDFLLLLLKMDAENKDGHLKEAYKLILATLSEWVASLVYGTKSFRRFTLEEYAQMGIDEDGFKVTSFEGGTEKVELLQGIHPYFDGESTFEVTDDLIALDLDISLLPEDDKYIAQQICCSYVNENFIKTNSAHPSKVSKLIFIIDEFHRMLKYTDARRFVSDLYRTGRKKNVSMWVITQYVSDYSSTDEGIAIYKNSACKIILKQDKLDMDFLRTATPLTESQITEVTRIGGSTDDLKDSQSDEHKGELCLIDNDKVVFVKVDYLKDVEARIVETDASNRRDLYMKGVI